MAILVWTNLIAAVLSVMFWTQELNKGYVRNILDGETFKMFWPRFGYLLLFLILNSITVYLMKFSVGLGVLIFGYIWN